MKEYFASPSVLGKSVPGIPIRLYFAISNQAISSGLLQDQDKVQKPAYFVSKVLQGPETRYQVIEKVAPVVVFAAQWLRHYFQSFTVIVMTNLPIRKVLQKPDIAGQMVRWAVELSEFDIQYEPQGPIKGQVYTNFMVELSSKDSQPDPNDFQWVL